jgi:lysylphosphatidylglycerol synthetase-like protein (DUF2156 family)
MRIIKSMLTSIGLLAATAGTALATPLAMLQDPQSPVQVDVHTTESHTVWYTNPMWLAIGGIVVLLIIVLAVMASRGGKDSGSSTTVVR